MQVLQRYTHIACHWSSSNEAKTIYCHRLHTWPSEGTDSAFTLNQLKSCGELEKLAQINTAYTTTNLGNFLVGELSEKLREIVLQSKIGIPNNPTKQDREISTITVCNRTTPPSNIPDDESVLRNLRGKKIESMARKYLRNLRQRAFVEKRL